jgi:hypothetical protein
MSEPQATEDVYRYCALKPQQPPTLPDGLSYGRAQAIQLGRAKWVNGTVMHYYFFDQSTDGENVTLADGSVEFVSWVGDESQRAVVRAAFKAWKDLGIGLDFVEVDDRSAAEIRIGFMFDFDGSWSYVGRDILRQGVNARTMNFGWDLTASSYGMTTAIHEIGHTVGMPHEHQNPFAGIEWDESAVYNYFGGPPNNWPQSTTFHNVLRKLSTAEVSGSTWDPDSVMEYAFPGGLIRKPAQYSGGLRPPGTISPVDASYVRQWYPPLAPALPTLQPFKSEAFTLASQQQVDFRLAPTATRTYSIGTFGYSDVVLVLFEKVGGDLQYISGDDDSGQDRNALLHQKLVAGREYVVRTRCYFSWESGQTALMYW